MAKGPFLTRHGIVRETIKKDVLFFAIPAILVFFFGLVVCVGAGWDGLFATLWHLARNPQSLYLLSIQNVLGLIMILGGFTIEIIAMSTIRRYHASTLVIREGHQLITHGIYHFTRHPIYLGVLMVCIGLPVYTSSLFGLLVMSVLIPLFLNRIRMEERLLIEEFGDAYRAYRESTRKLIPFIY